MRTLQEMNEETLEIEVPDTDLWVTVVEPEAQATSEWTAEATLAVALVLLERCEDILGGMNQRLMREALEPGEFADLVSLQGDLTDFMEDWE